jgi:hypothetical protein
MQTIVPSGTVSGTYFEWTRNNTTNVTFLVNGSNANSGTGNITGTFVNNTSDVQIVTFTITPKTNSGGVICTGTPTTATVTVNPCRIGCWSVDNLVASYNLQTNTTTFRWKICGNSCANALSNIIFGFPSGVTSSVSPANSSLFQSNLAIYRVVTPTAFTTGKRGSTTKYGIKFEYVSGTTLKNNCDEFEYVLAGNQVNQPIDIIIKAGKTTSTGTYIPTGCGNTLRNSITQGPLQTFVEGAANNQPIAAASLKSRVYPNPHKGVFNVQFTAIADGAATVEVYTMDGKRVQQKALQVRKGTQQTVPFTVPGKSSLIYRVINGGQSSSGRILPN